MTLQENIKNAQMDLITELGIDKLPEKEQQALFVQISEVLQQKIVLRLVEELPEERKEEFGKILEENKENPGPIEVFLKEALPNVEELILDEIGKYKQEAKQFLSDALGQKPSEDKEE